jgi:3-oxoacyl-[acyl-carrier-protein] synthase II
MSQRRVVITGLGAVTPVGNEVTSFWNSLVGGVSGIATVQAFDISKFDCRIAGEVKNFDPAPAFKNPKDARRVDRATQLAFAATKEAMAHAGLIGAALNFERAGVLVGSGVGGLKSLEDQITVLQAKGPGRVSPFVIPNMIANISAGLISMEYGFQGPNFAVVTACATGNQCVGESWRLIRDDEADVIIAGGTEAACTPIGMAGFAAMRAMSTRNDAPEKASRPFDKDRDGFLLGEGAGMVILEELEHAKKRGAVILAEVVGHGNTADAYHMTAPAPQGAGAARAMKAALRHARLAPEQVSYVNAHGTSTPQGDVCETQAIKSVFGPYAKNGLMVSSTKSMTGHLLGAAGAIEMVACVKAIQTGLIPPTINLDNPDPECDLDYVPHKAREAKVDVAMNNSFGFGGHNATTVLRKFA